MRTVIARNAAFARVVEEDGAAAKSVVIAYDRRFGSEEFAIAAAEILLAHGIPVAYSRTDVPTQMASYEVVMRGAAMGVVITASHNPPGYNGYKVYFDDGGQVVAQLRLLLEHGAIVDAALARTLRCYERVHPERGIRTILEGLSSEPIECDGVPLPTDRSRTP